MGNAARVIHDMLIHLLQASTNVIFRRAVQKLTQCVARILCDCWASCSGCVYL